MILRLDDRWAYPWCGVTFELRQVALGRGRRSKVRPCQMSVNEALYVGMIEGDRTARRKWTMVWSGCGFDDVLLPCPHGNEVRSCVGGVVEQPWSVCVHFGPGKLCVLIGIDCGLPVNIRWPVGTWLRMVVLFWAWPGLFLPAGSTHCLHNLIYTPSHSLIIESVMAMKSIRAWLINNRIEYWYDIEHVQVTLWLHPLHRDLWPSPLIMKPAVKMSGSSSPDEILCIFVIYGCWIAYRVYANKTQDLISARKLAF